MAGGAIDYTVPGNGRTYRLMFADELDKDGAAMSIYINRQALSAVSVVFREFFKRTDILSTKEIKMTVKGKTYEGFLELIQCIGDGRSQKSVDFGNVQILLSLAEEYCIDTLRLRCIAFVEQQAPNSDLQKKQTRDCLANLYALLVNTEEAGAFLTDAEQKISRFPLCEIRALCRQLPRPISSTLLTKLIASKVDRYVRLRRHPSSGSQHYSCHRCGIVGEIYFANECPAHGDTWEICRRQLFTRSLGGDERPIPGHLAMHAQCPDCDGFFRFSTETQLDSCSCSV